MSEPWLDLLIIAVGTALCIAGLYVTEWFFNRIEERR